MGVIAFLLRSRLLSILGFLPAIVLILPVAMEYAPRTQAAPVPPGRGCRVMVPGIRIDHVMLSRELTCVKSFVGGIFDPTIGLSSRR
ncbi:MAG TPA: hypothetical protein VL282_04420 [Tepidisphaeraceae bacterium]|nr:hypothetical protein [Tepidisphaeraceae bacterium]